jgi:hypothetical protein
LIHIQHERLRDVMPHEIEIRMLEQMGDIRLLAGKKIVDADDVVPSFDQPFAQMRPKKPGAAGDENAMDLRH